MVPSAWNSGRIIVALKNFLRLVLCSTWNRLQQLGSCGRKWMDGYFVFALRSGIQLPTCTDNVMWFWIIQPLQCCLSGVSDARRPSQTLPVFVTLPIFWWALPHLEHHICFRHIIHKQTTQWHVSWVQGCMTLYEVVIIIFSRQEDYVSLQEVSLPMWIQVSALHNWYVSLFIC